MSGRLRVLYAEDDPADADLTRASFERDAAPIDLEVVDSGRGCLERLAQERFDALLLDKRLPDMDGVALLAELGERGLALPVVVVTAAGDEAQAVQVLRSGACDYVPKEGSYLHTLGDVLRSAVEDYAELPEWERPWSRRPRRLLYAEHDPADVDLTRGWFERNAPLFRLEAVASSARAMARLHQASFDLLLIDLRMPDQSALDFLREAKHRRLQVPIVVVTGGGDEATAAAALRLGAYDYVVKRHGYLAQLPHVVDHAIARFQLRRLSRRLERELEERERLQRATAEQAAALADAAREKDEFIAMLGHELRNPLAPIRTAVELLLRSPLVDPVASEALDVMQRQISHMVRLLDDLLEVSRFASGRISLELAEIDLRRVVEEAVDGVNEAVLSRRQRLETSLPPHPLPVYGDVTRLVQVVVNLLNNAIKFTDPGGLIRVVAERREQAASIRVMDTGAGISPRLLSKIFDPFTQDERTLDRAQGGLGLGLALVRRIAELHGGSVEAHSAGQGKGTEIVVRLPLSVAAAYPADAAAAEPTGAADSPLRCLVVEDNADAARMLKIALELEGHRVELAFDGREAVEKAASFRPDAVVLDVGLPRLDGYQAARAIRQLPGLGEVPIVAVTGYGQELDRHRSRAAGFSHHLVKPISVEALLRALESGQSVARKPT